MKAVFLVLLCAAAASPLCAQSAPTNASPPFGLKEWTSGRVVPGSAAMYLVGNPANAEMFVARFKYPSGFLLGPHFHTATVSITVLQGSLVIGMGERVDSSTVNRMGPGSFVLLPAGMNHYEWFEGETVVHVQGVGPFTTKFLNPADDPRNRK